jgi:hypothetical protein
MGTLIAAVVIAAACYGIIPAIGAFGVRRSWRLFRQSLSRLSFAPYLSYRAVRSLEKGERLEYRFFGSLEAIQGDDTIWLRSPDLSVAVDMRKVSVFMIPASIPREGAERDDASGAPNVEQRRDIFNEETPERIPWKTLFSLPAGTQVFVGGLVEAEGGTALFKSTPEVPITVIIFDGDRNSMLRRCIWSGRQRNEYWNRLTPGSITLGFAALSVLLLGNVQAGGPRAVTLLVLELALMPIIALMPPGIVFVFGYTRLWKRARNLRADRDLLALPLRYFPAATKPPRSIVLPDGELYVYRTILPSEVPVLAGTVPMRIASPSVAGFADTFSWFGAAGASSEGTSASGPATAALRRPADPMAEYLIIPGDPIELSLACKEKARLFEILAGTVFTLGIAINAVLGFILLVALIK